MLLRRRSRGAGDEEARLLEYELLEGTFEVRTRYVHIFGVWALCSSMSSCSALLRYVLGMCISFRLISRRVRYQKPCLLQQHVLRTTSRLVD